MQALGKKDPKSIGNALKDFEGASEESKPTQEIVLIKVAEAQKHELDIKDRMVKYHPFLCLVSIFTQLYLPLELVIWPKKFQNF